MIRIEPVPERKQHQAIHFLAAGGAEDAMADAQAQSLHDILAARRPQSVHLWWALDDHCVAAAAVLDNAGATGFLAHCPLSAPGVRSPAVTHVVRAAAADGIRRGLGFVQALLDPPADAETAMLRAADFEQVAELIYMRLDLLAPPGEIVRPEVTWRPYETFTEPELADVIAATYRDSLDCPALSGRRAMRDVIEGHRATGVFSPRSWWIVEWSGQAAGCVLVNDDRAWNSAEVVYLGVVPEFRGHGLAADMVRHASADAWRRGRRRVTLAVDAGNHFARNVYEKAAFRATSRRLAWAMLGSCA